ncbi:MAG: WecB/TagA/CpsF family glycosyltransferase [Chloroflexi bacterium]|nr:WecB/TagA/CpsF family glycosyltransferase [Chloroflexota bacterium]
MVVTGGAVRILGVRVDDVTTAETLDLFRRYIAAGRPHQVVTVNPEFVMAARRDAAFARVLEAADLALPDGQGLLWAARVQGRALRERVCGSDIVPAAAALAAREGFRLFLLGAAPGVAERAAAVLTADNPSLQVVGTYAGSPSMEEEDTIVAMVRAAAPDLLFVAYGAPRQDLWIHRNLERLGVPVCMGVGGSLDFVAGVAVRAPRWARRWGLEWLHRLVQEPWRWRRMLSLPHYAGLVLRARYLPNVR